MNYNEIDLDKLTNYLSEFFKSEEGQAVIKEAIDNTVKACKYFSDATKISIDNLFRPMDI